MYHNGEDISAYLDGELPADAASELERRLETDITAREELNRLRGLSETLHAGEEPDFSTGKERVWARLESRLGLKPPLWRRRVSVPYPAVAAAAVVAFALVGLVVWFAGPDFGGIAGLEPTAARHADARIAVGGMDGEELLGWLEEQDLAGDVSMQLPDTASFRIMGEPQLLKAADRRTPEASPES